MGVASQAPMTPLSLLTGSHRSLTVLSAPLGTVEKAWMLAHVPPTHPLRRRPSLSLSVPSVNGAVKASLTGVRVTWDLPAECHGSDCSPLGWAWRRPHPGAREDPARGSCAQELAPDLWRPLRL